MSRYLILAIVFGAAAFCVAPMPWKCAAFLKKIAASAMVAALLGLCAASILTPVFFPPPTVPLKITATGEQNPSAEGSEIHIQRVLVDGEPVPLAKIFPNNWVRKDGQLQWRSYDQPDGMSEILQGKVPLGGTVEVVFEQNKWQGIATLELEGQMQTVDCYQDSEGDSTVSVTHVLTMPEPEETGLSPRVRKLIVAGGAFMICFVVLLYLFHRGGNPFAEPVFPIPPQKKEVWADLLRVVSAFTVVFLHCTCNIYNTFTENIQTWYGYLYINCLTTFAVPCFFMLSGAFLLPRKHIIQTTLRKRFPRLLIPLVAWSAVYILVRIYYWNEEISFVRSMVKSLFSEQYWHLWYLYPLIGLYLLTPLISTLYNRLGKSEKLYGLCLFLIVPACVSTLSGVVNWGLKIPDFALMFPYFGIFWGGAILVEYRQKIAGKWKWLTLSAVFGLFLVIFFSYYVSNRSGAPDKSFFDMGKIPVIVLCFSVFALFLSLEDQLQRLPAKVKRTLGELSNLSFGVYLIHMLFLAFVGNIWIGPIGFTNDAGALWNMLLGALLYFSAAVSLSYVLSKIPYIRRIIG